MANASKASVSFDSILQQDRKKRQAEQLAQQILGKSRRATASPAAPRTSLNGSLASRVGVTKRNAPTPRSSSPRNPPPSTSRNKVPRDNVRSRPLNAKANAETTAPAIAKSNGYTQGDASFEAEGMTIRGAAGPFTVVAQNFALGTTAADIESVMLSVGGAMTACKLVASNPTVIAEMSFLEKVGAEKVIETFNGKKADGQPLYVYWKGQGGEPQAAEPEPPARVAEPTEDVIMEVDETAQSREAQNRLREERRGGESREVREVFPAGAPSQQRGGYYDSRAPRYPEPSYPNGRYGYRGGPPGRYGGRGGFGSERRYGGGQSWRP